MEFIERLKQTTGRLALPRHSRLNPKQKLLLHLGCAALAVMLAVGSVPFLRGFAAEEEASVSGSDIVSGSDGDIVSGSDGAVVIDGGTAEPKPAKSDDRCPDDARRLRRGVCDQTQESRIRQGSPVIRFADQCRHSSFFFTQYGAKDTKNGVCEKMTDRL